MVNTECLFSCHILKPAIPGSLFGCEAARYLDLVFSDKFPHSLDKAVLVQHHKFLACDFSQDGSRERHKGTIGSVL